jgi:hypothetical protein
MATYRTVLTLHSSLDDARDSATATLHFATDEGNPTADIAHALNGHVARAWSLPGTRNPGRTPGQFLAGELSRVIKPSLKTYQERGSLGPNGSPLAVDDFPGVLPAPVDAQSLPPQVACCLSVRADYGSAREVAPDGADINTKPDHQRARRRGRIYFGPLILGASEGAPGRPSVGLRNVLLDLADKLHDVTHDATLVAANAKWVVWSGVVGEQQVFPITSARVDDSWDIQRRRKIRQTGSMAVAY